MVDYDWRCHSCKALNRAGTETCHACGCPALASARDIEAAKTGEKPEPFPTRKEAKVLMRAQMAVLPWGKKPLAYVLRGLNYLGWAVFGIGLWNLAADGMLIGLAIVVIASLLFALLTWSHEPRQG